MKDYSKTTVVLGTALCAVVILNNSASAMKAVETQIETQKTTPKITHFSNRTTSKLIQNTTYTANGKMDKKTAVMLVNLLRNPHLQVRATVNGQRLQTISPKQTANKKLTDVFVNYTVTGKTDRKTVLKLKKLMQNSKHLQISAQMNINTNQQRITNTPRPQNHPQFIGGYTPFYASSLPPVYVQGNTVWMPIPVTMKMNTPVTQSITTTPEMIAGK